MKKEMEQAINNLNPSEVILLENVKENDLRKNNDFAKSLASLCDVFINDSFNTIDKIYPSNYTISSNIKESAIGYQLKNELDILLNTMNNPQRPLVALIGGNNLIKNLDLINNLIKKVDKLIIGGPMGFLFWKAQGINIETSNVDNKQIILAKEYLTKYDGKIVLPIDASIKNSLNENAKVFNIYNPGQISFSPFGLDVGPKTIELFKKELQKAQTIIWHGSLGKIDFYNHLFGAKEIAKAVSDLTNTFTVVGGEGDLDIINFLKLNEKFSHVSMNKDSYLSVLKGKKMIALDIINNIDSQESKEVLILNKTNNSQIKNSDKKKKKKLLLLLLLLLGTTGAAVGGTSPYWTKKETTHSKDDLNKLKDEIVEINFKANGNVLPSKAKEDIAFTSTLPKDVSIDWIIIPESINDENGTLKIKFKLNWKQNSSDYKELIVRGFKTTDQQNKDDVNNFIANLQINLTPTKLGTKILPNNITDITRIDDYVQGFPKPINDIIITKDSIQKQNNDLGQLELTLTFTKGKTSVSKQYLVSGFKTTKMQDKDDVDNFVENLQINLTPTKLGTKILPNNITDITRIDDYVQGFPKPINDIIITKDSIQKQNNDLGQLELTLTFTKGKTSVSKQYLVSGFKTTKMQDKDDVDNFVENLQINLIPTELGTQTLPENIIDINMVDQYVSGFPSLSNNIKLNIKLIKNQSNDAGSLVLGMEFSKGSYIGPIIEKKVEGFKTTFLLQLEKN